MDDILHTLGTNLRRERTAKGLSQEELADRSGLHRTYVGAVERGEKNISTKNIARLSKALGIPPHVLLLPSKRA